MTEIEKKLREICTYSSVDGTSGYLLSEEQFDAILSLISEEVEGIIGEDEKIPTSKDLEEEYQLNQGNIDRDTIFQFHLSDVFTKNNLRAEQRKKLEEIVR